MQLGFHRETENEACITHFVSVLFQKLVILLVVIAILCLAYQDLTNSLVVNYLVSFDIRKYQIVHIQLQIVSA